MSDRLGERSKCHGSVIHYGTGQGRATDDPRAWLLQCGHCGRTVSAAVIAALTDGNYNPYAWWLRCTSCGEPSARTEDGTVHPPGLRGEQLDGLPTDTDRAYLEARRCLTYGAYTACELVCRKILMHVAVDKGAKPGDTFASYLEGLANAGYVTPPMSPWVDAIRTNANEATHSLPATTEERAADTLSFTTQLLRLIYEMEHRRQQGTAAV